ncbi:MAG TPA: hypothetical protein VFH29_03840 [Anaerolineales bacterium]|nr:hypothetical protein [Anaerolineales bacterium]
MNIQRGAAILFAVFAVGVAGFQIALALGAPWGSYAMGGAYPGQFPAPLRIGAAAQAAVLLLWAGVLLARAGVALAPWLRASRWLVWVVVAFSAISLLLNLITPSGGERLIWAPVALVMLVASILVATGRQGQST